MRGDRPRVLVVGAGVVGRSVAYHLCRQEFAVTLIDAGPDISITTSASLGVLTHFNGGDNPLSRFYRDGHEGYGPLAERLRDETGVDIGWREQGGIDLIFTDDEEEKGEELLRFNQERGCPVERLDAERLLKLEPQVAKKVRGGLYFPGDHRVDPEMLSAALLKGVLQMGGEARFGERLEGFDEVTEEGIVARTDAGRHWAELAVLAAGSWTRELGEWLGTTIPVRPIRGQHARFDGESVGHVLRHGGHHLLSTSGCTAVGATVEEVGFEPEPTTAAAQEFCGVLEAVLERKERPRQQRAGLRPKPKGGRPLIGPLRQHPNIFAATGHYKNGILMGSITGEVVAAWMATGQAPRDMDYFAPER